MQPCKTGDQQYSDASPNGECSLDWEIKRSGERDRIKIPIQNKVDLFLLIGDCTFQDEILTHANSKTQNLSFISSQKKSS